MRWERTKDDSTLEIVVEEGVRNGNEEHRYPDVFHCTHVEHIEPLGLRTLGREARTKRTRFEVGYLEKLAHGRNAREVCLIFAQLLGVVLQHRIELLLYALCRHIGAEILDHLAINAIDELTAVYRQFRQQTTYRDLAWFNGLGQS